MMEFFTALSIFLTGMATGGAMFVLYGLYQLRKVRKVKNAIVNELKKQTENMEKKRDSVKERLSQAAEIARMQVEMRAQIDSPSKNSLHSRYKNGLIYEITELERQKLGLLKSIIADGIDPVITVMNQSGQREDLPLSAYINSAEQALAESGVDPVEPTNKPQEAIDAPKKVGKFIVLKGGKDDKIN